MEDNKTNVIEVTLPNKKPALLKLYPYIVAWGQALGSFGYYIEDQVAKALKDNAPKNAIYLHKDGSWETIDGIRPALKEELDDYIKGERGGIIVHWYEDEFTPEILKPYIYGNS